MVQKSEGASEKFLKVFVEAQMEQKVFKSFSSHLLNLVTANYNASRKKSEMVRQIQEKTSKWWSDRKASAGIGNNDYSPEERTTNEVKTKARSRGNVTSKQ